MAFYAPEVIFFIRLNPCFPLFSQSHILVNICDQQIDFMLKSNYINGNGFEFKNEMEAENYCV